MYIHYVYTYRNRKPHNINYRNQATPGSSQTTITIPNRANQTQDCMAPTATHDGIAALILLHAETPDNPPAATPSGKSHA
jgi:hypothetical protein